jgi:hypothetical protein
LLLILLPQEFSFTNQPLGATQNENNYTNLTGSLNPGIYFQFTITPIGTNTIDLSKITFTFQRSGTGVRTYAVRSSTDSYVTNLPASINPANADLSVQTNNVFFTVLDATTPTAENGSTITLGGSSFTAISTPVTFRFYGWNAEATGGTFSIDNVVITGNVNILGIQENTISGLNIYPNPVVNGTFYVDTEANATKSVSIFDVLGKEVAKTTISGNTVNVNNLGNGIYFVKITEEGKTATKKLFIK